MTSPRWLQDARAREHEARWRRYGMLQHNHSWADTLRPSTCGACKVIAVKEVGLWK